MKTKPKLIRVLVPPVSLMMMNHRSGTPASTRTSGEEDTDEDIIHLDVREALYASLVRNRPLAGLIPPTFAATPAPATATTATTDTTTPSANRHHQLPSGYKLQHVTFHPSKPLVTYLFLLSEDNEGGSGGGESSIRYDPKNTAYQWIIVQDTATKQIVFSISLDTVALEAAAMTTLPTPSSGTPNTAGIPSVSQLSFLDQATLYWNGFAGGTHSGTTTTTTRTNNEDGNHRTTEEEEENDGQCWSYLMIHCPNRIVILDLRQRRSSYDTTPAAAGAAGAATPAATVRSVVLANIVPHSFITGASVRASGVENGKGKTPAGRPPSLASNAVLALSRTQLLIACLDGSFKRYDWHHRRVITAYNTWTDAVWGFTATTKSTDAVVHIIAANPYSYDPAEAMSSDDATTTTTTRRSMDRDTNTEDVDLRRRTLERQNPDYLQSLTNDIGGRSRQQKKRRKLVICFTKKSVAYLCYVPNKDSNRNSDSNNKIIIPLARLEGGAVPMGEESVVGSMEHVTVRYDAVRDLLFWMVPSKNNKTKLFVWDIATIVANVDERNDHASKNSKSKQKRQSFLQQSIPQPDPILITQFSYEGKSHMIFPGWLHESFPSDSVACLAVTKDGELQLSVAPLHNSGSSMKTPFPAATVWTINLSQVMVRDLQLSPEDSNHHPRFKVQSVKCASPLQDSSTLFVGTTIGILRIKLLDGLVGIASPGTRFVHFNANFGTMGKSVLSVQGSQISYSALESPLSPLDGNINNSNNEGSSCWTLDKTNLIGKMEYYYGNGTNGGGGDFVSSLTGSVNTNKGKIASVVYDSHQPLHLPAEVRSKGTVRLPPRFLPSPSGRFVCCMWLEEMRYEILIVSNLLESVSQGRRRSLGHHSNNPLAASGTGVASFAWVGDSDVFCLLYDPEQDSALKAGINLGAPDANFRGDTFSADKIIKDLGKMKTYKKGVKSVVGTAGKLKSIEGLRDLGKDTGKLGKGAFKGMKKVTGKVAVGVTQGTAQVANATTGAGKIAVKGTKKGAKRVSKKMTFGWGKKKDKKGAQESLASAESELEDFDEAPTIATTPIDIGIEEDPEAEERAASEQLEKKAPWVELRMLVGSSSDTDENGGNVTTVSNLGQLTLRTGNRNPPTVLFGGPVLCVGSKFDETDEGLSYFYTKKSGEVDESALAYVSTGPAFPCPDNVAWDDDGKLCAIVIKGSISVYLSDEPNFIMIGTMALSYSSDVDVISLRFIHGVLYCTTKSSVRCIFLGDLHGDVCHLDSYTLASSCVPMLPSKSIVTEYTSLTPPTIPMPLDYSEVLGYQNGSLILSTITGVIAIPLEFPLLRIGVLISAGSDYYSKAERWFSAVPKCDHEALAIFLERRGVPDLALNLDGISLETTVDICMRYGFVDRLEEVVDEHGLDGLRAIDMSRGVSSNVFGLEEHGASVAVCVGAFLLSYGRIELVRRLATECLSSSNSAGKQEAFVLAGLLLSVNGCDSESVIHRAVQIDEKEDDSNDWLVGSFVRKHIL